MNVDWGLPIEIVKDVIDLNAKGMVFEKLEEDAPIRLLFGTAGSGKTSWAVNFCMGGNGYLFVSAVELIDLMVACKTSDEVKALERKAQRAQWLIIDEVGLEGNIRFNKYGTEFNSLDIIRRILMARLVQNKITILTTNMAPEALFAKYDKVNDTSGRIYSRFSNHARIYFMEGDRRQTEKKDQIFRCREKLHLDEYLMLDETDEAGEKAKKLVPLGDRKRRTIPLYDESEKERHAAASAGVPENDAASCVLLAKKHPKVFLRPTVSWLKGLADNPDQYPWAEAKLKDLLAVADKLKIAETTIARSKMRVVEGGKGKKKKAEKKGVKK